MTHIHEAAKPNPILMLVVSAVALGLAPAGSAQNQVAIGGGQEVVVEDDTSQASTNVGSDQVFTSGNVPGSPIAAEFNNTGAATRSTVYAVGKLAGYWTMLGRNVGVQGHIPGTGSGGWGAVGSYGGYANPDNTGIDSPTAWGALG